MAVRRLKLSKIAPKMAFYLGFNNKNVWYYMTQYTVPLYGCHSTVRFKNPTRKTKIEKCYYIHVDPV